MDFSPRTCLKLLLAVFLLLAGATAVAQEERHTIIVLDLGMPAEQIARASDLSRSIAQQAPVEHRLALVGADEIVHHLISPAAGQAFGVQFDAIAGELRSSEFSSFSSGLERAVALARETGAPSTLLVFSSGRISASNPGRNDRYEQWAHSIIIPDAASAGIKLIFASPEPLKDTLATALQLASPHNISIDLNEADTASLTALLFTPDTVLADNQLADQQAAEKLAAEQALAEQQAAERLAAEQAERQTADRLAAEQAERQAAERLAAEQAERQAAERLAAEQAERQAAERLAAEQAERQAAERLASEQAERQAAATQTENQPVASPETDTDASASQPTISITATPVESDSSGLAIVAAVLALLLGGVGGWWFWRRRGGDSPTANLEHGRSSAIDIQAQARSSGEATLVKSPQAGVPAPSPSATVAIEPDVATMVNPQAPPSPVADEATSINTDSHAFRDSPITAEDEEEDTVTALSPARTVSPDEPTLATGKIEEAAGFPPAPPPNPADEFAVFENSINAKRSTGKESAEQRKRESLAALSRDRTGDRTFDPAMDAEDK